MKKFLETFMRWRFKGQSKELMKRNLLREEDVILVIDNVDCTNPKNRRKNFWDTEFVNMVPVLHRYERALNFIDLYWYVRETYLENLGQYHPECNAELQRAFCSVHYNDLAKKYFAAYRCLLYHYLEKNDFLPEILEELKADKERYWEVLDLYEHRK